MFEEKEEIIKHLDGTESKGINIKYSEGKINLFKWYDDQISFNVIGVRGGAKVNSYISYKEIRRLRDWINYILEDQLPPAPPDTLQKAPPAPVKKSFWKKIFSKD